MQQSDYPILKMQKDRVKNRFYCHLLTTKPATMTQECYNQHPSLSTLKSKGISRSKMKW